MRNFLKNILPDWAKRFLSGLFYGWHGNYSSWEEASTKSDGYGATEIVSKSVRAAEKIRQNSILHERDTVIYNETEYSFPLLSALMWIAAKNKGKLSVLDFGGSFGSTYFQNKKFLDDLEELNWHIVEQEEVVRIGRDRFTDSHVRFYFTIQECLNATQVDVIIFSSVLQYLKEPYKTIEEAKDERIPCIIVDRTPFVEGPDRITIQKVKPSIYKAKYPCWFFNKSKFMSSLSEIYDLKFEFDALDRANLKSEFKGFLFELRR